MPDLAAYRETVTTARFIADFNRRHNVNDPWVALYERDVTALLAALLAALDAQKEPRA